MRRGKPLSIFVLAGCMAAVALISAFAGYGVATKRILGDEAVVFADGGQDYKLTPTETEIAATLPSVQIIDPPAMSDTIAIPGFKKLTAEGQTLKAGAITNPEQNTCYFVVVLTMPGGAEIYRSSYLAPGQSLGNVEMLVPLSPKEYEGVTAQYSCYTMDELKPLNGADITFTLEVLP